MEDILITGISAIYKYKTERAYWENNGENRNFHCLAYQVSGEYDHEFPFETLKVKSDTLFFINKNDPYKATRKEMGESICVTFSGTTDLKSSVWDFSDNPKLLNCFHRLYKLNGLNFKSDYYSAISILYEIFSLAQEKSELPYYSSKTKSKIIEAHKYITEHFTGEINITNLAKSYDLSVKHFRNMFKDIYGATPTQYIINMRLNLAVSLLNQNRSSIQEVAEITGFKDVYYFSRLFKKKFSVPPVKYINKTSKSQ